MASINITGEELLEALEKKIQHMLDCEQFIFDLHNHPEKPLTKKYTDNHGKALSQWDQDKIDAASRFVTEYGPTAELIDLKKLRPVEAFLAELPRLRKAEDVVKSLGYVLRYQLPEPSREERIKMFDRYERTLRDRLDSLTNFDDSE